MQPAVFWRDVLGAPTFPAQARIAELVRDNSRVAVVGANSSGKDWEAGRIMLWWQSTRYPAITVVIGPTHRQVGDIVWREARAAYLLAKVPLGGEFYETPRWAVSDRHYALGFATDRPFNIQGFHSPNLLVIITEAHNVSQEHIEAVKRLNPSRLLLTGNPLSTAGEFHGAFHERADMYQTHSISAFDTPNVQQRRTVIPGLVTLEDVEARRKEWGEESALYIASILGQFPDNLEDCIVPRSLILAAMQRVSAPAVTEPAMLSCDVARYGEDKTVVYRRQGHQCRMVWKTQGKNTQAIAGQLTLMAEQDVAVTTIIVDDTGVGGGVTDRLRENQPRKGTVRIVAFNGGNKAAQDGRYVNAVAEAWYELALAFRAGQIGIDNNPALIAQLSARRYTIQGDRRIKLESKEDYKKRVNGSPDDADALAMAYSPLIARLTMAWRPL